METKPTHADRLSVVLKAKQVKQVKQTKDEKQEALLKQIEEEQKDQQLPEHLHALTVRG